MRLFIMVCLAISCWANAQNYSSFVNPFIGTGGHGHTYPGATAPFGMVQLSPDTRIDGSWDGCSGYHYSDHTIYGFSHTHLNGTGVSDYGDFMFLPTFGLNSYEPENYASPFSHSNEKAATGYYSVFLDKYNTQVELTAGTYTGFHQYTFKESGKLNLLLDLNHRDELLEGEIIQIDNRTFLLKRRSKAWAQDQYMFAYVEFEKPVEFKIVETNGTPNGNTINATKLKALFSKEVQVGEVFKMKVSLSFTGYEGAQRNSSLLKTWDFNMAKAQTQAQWDQELSKIEIVTDDSNDRTIFYTALYHTMVQPNIAEDIDGQYRGRDNQLHFAKDFDYYTVFSLWDTFRAAHPLYTLIEPKRDVDFINTFLKEYEQGGRLPVWEFASNETDCMIGYHSVSVMADAMSKGLTGFDYNLALEAAQHSADLNGLGLEAYKKNHFISVDDEHESVSKTLEYAYDDWCIAQMARLLHRKDVYQKYKLRSESWRNVFDTEMGFMRPRQNGGWYSPFEPREVNNHYTEGNSWQYSFFVPQDIKGMIEAYGGKTAFEKKLDELFSASNKTTGRTQVDITGLIGQYAHGNEPSHHIAWLYNYVDKPEKTKEKIHYILKEFYKNAPDGIIGNEDCGQMSAWYVLSSLGIYKICPGAGDSWDSTEPYFEKAILHIENDEDIIITKESLEKKRKFLQNNIAHISSKPLPPIVNRSEKGKKPKLLIPTPIIGAPSKTFKDEMKISVSANSRIPTQLFYSIDGTNFIAYNEPFNINKTSAVYAYAVENNTESDTISGYFYKKPNNYTIQLFSKYNPQYNAGGDQGLVDGIHGDLNWRKGDWQGYQSTDFEAIVDLQKPIKISEIHSTYLQDSRSWIVMPTKVEYYVSKDGEKFVKVGEVANDVDPKQTENSIKDFSITVKKTKARYLKVIARNYGKLPEWHQGYGGDAFIFVDEIEVK